MRTGHASEAAVIGSYILEVVGDDRQTVVHHAALETEVVRRVERHSAAVEPGTYRSLAGPDDIEVDMVEAELFAEQLCHVGRYHRVVDEVEIILSPVQQRYEPVGAHIRWALISDTLVEHVVESGHLLLGQCIRYG